MRLKDDVIVLMAEIFACGRKLLYNIYYFAWRKAMGFFDSLLKSGARKLVSDMVDKAVDGVMGGGNSNGSYNNSGNAAPVRNNANTSNVSKIPRGVGPTCARIEHVVRTKFPDYELRKDVPASIMQAKEGAVPYTYVMFYQGTPIVCINVIDNRNDYSLKRFRLAKEACVQKDTPHFNFFSHLPNDMEYIERRLGEFLYA